MRNDLTHRLSLAVALFAWCVLFPAFAVAAPELPNTLGEQRVLVILLRFPGSVAPQTAATVRAHFAAASDWFREASYGQTWLAPTVVGWYDVPVTLPSCTITAVAQHGDAAATAAGVPIAEYPRRFYVFSHNNLVCSCTAGSLVGAVPSRAYQRGSVSLYTIVHELGHSLGLRHSHAWDCSEGPLTGSCVSDEYGDRYDIMGHGSVHHYNAYQKQRLGWLDTPATPTIIRPTAPGVYTIHPYALANSGPVKALQYGVFYVEYRTRAGVEATALARDGVLVHWVTGSNQSHLVDPRPNTSDEGLFWLNVGDVITDPSNPNVKIITRSVSPTEARVELVIGPAPPLPPILPTTGVYAAPPAGLLILWTPGDETATHFIVERNVDGVGPFVALASVAEAPYVDATGLPETTYCYRVFAVNENGASLLSEVACGTTPPAPDALVAERTFTRLSGGNETFPVPVGAYTCARMTGGTNALRILQGTTVRANIKPTPANPPVGTRFTLRCEVTATEVRAFLDGVLRLTVGR